MTNQDFSKIYNGKVSYFNINKHYGFIACGDTSYYFFVDVEKIRTENRALRKQKIKPEIKREYSVGDEVNFKLKLNHRNNIEAYDIEYLENTQRKLLIDEAEEKGVLSGYLKKIENKFFVKHVTTYILIPVTITRYEVDTELIYENRINQIVQFQLQITKKDKLKASLIDKKFDPNWEKLEKIFKRKEIVSGCIIDKYQWGLIVDVLGINALLFNSQIDEKPVDDYDALIGKTMEFVVCEFEKYIHLAVSHKAIKAPKFKEKREKREKIISNLKVGQILEGVVKGIRDFGVFVDLGGIDGMIYSKNLSWSKINHPNEILTIGEKIKVKVLYFNLKEDKKIIHLGYKQLFSKHTINLKRRRKKIRQFLHYLSNKIKKLF